MKILPFTCCEPECINTCCKKDGRCQKCSAKRTAATRKVSTTRKPRSPNRFPSFTARMRNLKELYGDL